MENLENRENCVLASKKRRKNKTIAILSAATAVLSATTLGFAIGYGASESKAGKFKEELENVYNDNFYNLLDSVNNLENKIAKTLSATSSTYQRKTLLEASKNASEAEISISGLPLSGSDIQDTTRMVNQVAGYTSTLAEKIASGESLTEDELASLESVHESILALKEELNRFERKLNNGYSIVDSSMNFDENGNEFYASLSSKSVDIEYPTMIYDGPFSDSVVNSTVKGLNGEKLDKDRVQEEVERCFKDIVELSYEGETNGRFETYNYRVTNSSGEYLFVQAAKIEGHILTISGAGADGDSVIDIDEAKKMLNEMK